METGHVQRRLPRVYTQIVEEKASSSELASVGFPTFLSHGFGFECSSHHQ